MVIIDLVTQGLLKSADRNISWWSHFNESEAGQSGLFLAFKL